MDFQSKYDIIGFANDLGLSLVEVSELYAELISEINSALIELNILMEEKNLVKIQKIIHNIKGISGNYRISDVYEKSTYINDALKNTTPTYTDIENDLNHFFIISSMALNRIQKFFAEKSIII